MTPGYSTPNRHPRFTPAAVFQSAPKIFRGFAQRRCVNRNVSQNPSEQDLIDAYRRTLKPLYAWVSCRVGGDVSLAEGLVQDAWVRAIGSWSAKGIPDDVLAWLVRVARNTRVSPPRRG
jgi:hypothetical protein